MTAPRTAAGWARFLSDWLAVEEPNQDGEWKAFCPLHEDPETSETPSASFNFSKGAWHCFGGCKGMTLSALVREMSKRGKGGNVVDLDTRRKPKSKGRPTEPLPTDDDVAVWHERLMKDPALLRVMTDERGLTRATLKEYSIGFHRGRYTIPVYDEGENLVNVRRYKPNTKEPRDKMVSFAPGYGEARLFLPWVAADHEEIVITEGEMDALCCQAHDLPFVMGHTGGSNTWKMEWCKAFVGKHVFLCYDLDDAGFAGARRAAEALKKVAEGVYLIRLPMNLEGGDATDFFVKQGRSKSDFLTAMDAARERPLYLRGQGDILPEPKRVSLEDSQDAGYGDQPLEMFATIAGKITPAFVAPARVDFKCDISWRQEACSVCPMNARDGVHEEAIQPHDSNLLKIVGFSEGQYREVLHSMVGIPPRCPRVEIKERESYSVEELVISPSVAHRTDDTQRPLVRRAYNVGHHATPINSTARIVAKQLPDPRDRRGMLLAYECEPVETDLDRFQVTADVVERLKVFRPEPGQTPIDKMEDIADDLAANVTHIYGRPELHIAYDVVWHSVMNFRLFGTLQEKGWLELCVIGDTRTGKSECARQLSRHYSAGVVQSCEGASFAGLVGGAQQIGGSGKTWVVTWGLIPLNDRRLVVLDEFGGIADKGIIEQMSDIRSSGKATITKIQTDETSARTRLIWIANPLDGKSLAELHQPGISALQTLVTKPEDIARFDLAMACASSDVDPTLINTVEHDPVPHTYTKELCSLLVQWAWSRRPDDILFREGVERAIVDRANELGKRYVPEPPLVQVENVRVKLARLAVAIAARTFSSDRTGKKIVVKMSHLESAIALMDRLYGMKSMAYMSASRRIVHARTQAEMKRKEARRYLRLERDTVTATLMAVRNNNGFKMQDFKIFGSLDDAGAQAAVKELTKMGMIRGISHGKIKIEPPLMELLQEIEESEEHVI
jgi:hypothetical protein